jgi:hypothetical protein
MKWLALFFWVCRHGALAASALPSLASPSASANEMKRVGLPPGAWAGRSIAPRLALKIGIQSVALVVLPWLVHQNKGTL